MVGVVVGSRLGLEQTSAWVLGSRGQIGQSSQGRAGDNVFVNAATGNLVITNRDEFLVGQGPDSALARTYNSQGAWDGDNNDGWREGVTRRITTPGGIVTRTDWDGSQVAYTGSASTGYVTHEGAGAYDTLVQDGANWIWTDGDSRIRETYSASGVSNDWRLVSQTDTDGNGLTFAYNSNGYVSRVTTQTVDGHTEYTDLTYGTGSSIGDLLELKTSYWDLQTASTKTLTRTRYAYDASHRLTSVTVDLSPDDNSIAVGATYVTTYAYFGSSTRVSSITQTDGSKIDITYESSGAFRVTSITQTISATVTRGMTFTYVSSTRTDVTDTSSGLTTQMVYTTGGLLTKVTEVDAVASGVPRITEFLYTANDDLAEVRVSTDGSNYLTRTEYDYGTATAATGLWIARYEHVVGTATSSVVTTRTYSSSNALLTESRYQSLDSNGSTAGGPSDSLTTRYVYDSENHLRFVVTATGEVTQFEYTTSGNMFQSTRYTGTAYDLTGVAFDASLAESTMSTWVAGISDKTAAQITQTVYNFRGEVTDTYASSKATSAGGPDSAAPTTHTIYVYDQAGKLLSRYVSGLTGTESFVYDGMGRLVASTDFNGAVTTVAFLDARNTTVVRLADGLNQISIYDGAGELISYAETERSANLVNLTGWPQGTPPTGPATVPGWQDVTAFTSETQWATVAGPDGRQVVAMQSGQTVNTANGGGNFTDVTAADTSKAYEFVFYFRKADLTRHHVYFGANVSTTLDNATTGATDNNPYFYYSSAATQQSTLQSDRWYKVVGYILPQGSATVVAGALGGVYDMSTGAKVADSTTYRWNASMVGGTVGARFFNYYDETNLGNSTYFYQPEIHTFAGDQISELLPATGTQYRYDNAGRLRLEVDPTGVKTHHLYDKVGRKVADIDADGSLTEYRYDLADRLVSSTRYATRLTSTQLASLTDAAGNPTAVDLATVRPTGTADDSWNWRIYDGADRLLQTINGEGATSTYAYDGASRLLSQTSYATRLTSTQVTGFKTTPPTTQVAPSPSATEDRTSRLFYDAAGRQIGALDAEGYFSRIVYDSAGQVIRTTAFAARTTNPSGSYSTLETEFTSTTNANDINNWSVFDGRGFLRGTANGLGEVVLYDYTPLGHVSQIVRGRKLAAVPTSQPTLAQLTAASASSVVETTNYTRNQLGQVLTEARILAGGTETVTYTYDSLHRLVAQSTDRVTGQDYETRQRYDRRGRVIGQLSGEGAAALAALGGSPTKAQIDGIYRKWGVNLAYDDADRLISRLDADGLDGAGNRTLYFYDADGNLAFQVDPLGGVTGYSYDALNRQTKTIAFAQALTSTQLADLAGGGVKTPLDTTPWLRSAPPSTASVTIIAYNVTDTVRTSQTQVTDTTSVTTTLAYDAFGELISRIDPKGSVATPVTSETTFAYDRRGLLKQTVEDNGSGHKNITRSTTYDAFGRAITSTDPRNGVRSMTYDRAGRMVTWTDANSKVTEYQYDARGQTLSVKDRNGASTLFSHDAFSRQVTMTTPTGLVTTTTYDDLGHTLSISDGGGRSMAYTYDRNGALKTTTNGLGQAITSTYDFSGHLYETVDATGLKVRYTYDAASQVLTQSVDPTNLNLVTTYVYDAKGQRTRVTDPSGVRTDFEFDLAGQQTKVITDPTNLAITTAYTYDRAGNLTSLQEAVGASAARETRYTYDLLDRRTSSADADAALNIQTTYAYDAAGNVAKRTDKISASEETVTRYIYDAENRLTVTVDGAGSVKSFTYDGEGRLTSSSEYAVILDASFRTSIDATPTSGFVLGFASTGDIRTTRLIYDQDGRLVFTLDAASQLSETVYDGSNNAVRQILYATVYAGSSNPTESVLRTWTSTHSVTADRTDIRVYDDANRQVYALDAANQLTAFAYDAAGRVIRTVDYATIYSGAANPTKAQVDTWVSSNAVAADRKTQVVYDSAGRAAFTIDAVGYITRTLYNGAGQTASVSRFTPVFTVADASTFSTVAALVAPYESSAATTSFNYDAAGRQWRRIDAEGVQTLFDFDGLGRVIGIWAAYGTADQVRAVRQYDDGGRLTLEIQAYAAPIQPNGAATQRVLSWTYDGMGRMLVSTDGTGQPASRTYDLAGRVLSVTVPISSSQTAVTTNQYDAFGNLVKVTDPRGGIGYFYYDSLNRQTLQIDPENFATRTTYDRWGAVVSLTRYATHAGTGATIYTAPTINTAALDATTTFEHDKLNRVTKVIDALGFYETYGLNAFGDRVTLTNKVGAVTSYIYDKRGLMLTEILPVSSIRNDETVEATAVTNTYQYDSRGNRTQMVEASGLHEQRTTNYVYDKLDRLAQTTRNAFTVTSATTFATSTATPTETISYDRRGNVIETVNSAQSRTLFYYDGLDRKIGEVDASGTLRVWDYDANSNAIHARVYDTPITLATTAGGALPSAGTPSTYREITYGYDRNNRQTSMTIASLRTGEYGSAFTSSVGSVTVTTVYDAAGNVIQTTDGRGNSAFNYFDKLGRAVATVDAEGYLTTYVRDAEGNVTSETRYATRAVGTPSISSTVSGLTPTAVTGSDRTTVFTYDKNGQRLTEKRLGVISHTVNATTGALTAATTDALIQYEYNALGLVTKKIEATNDFVDYGYDNLGRQVSAKDSSITDSLGTSVRHKIATSHNGLGEVTRTVEGADGAAVGTARVTTYTYTTDGHLSSVTDGTGFTTSYGYDVGGRTVMEQYTRLLADGSTVLEARNYRYDVLERVVFQAVAAKPGSTWTWGDTTTITYNAHGEVTARAMNTVTEETFSYDAAGRMWRSTAGDGVTRFYLYDKAGKVTATIASTGADLSSWSSIESAVTALTNSGASAIGTVDVSGVAMTFSVYDKRGQSTGSREPFRQTARNLTTSAYTTSTIVRSQTYNAFGEVTQQTDARGYATDFAYNTMGRIIEQKSPQVAYTNEAGTVINARPTETRYYDLAGRMVAIRDANGNLNRQALLDGTGHNGREAVVIAHFDAGASDSVTSGITRYGVDVFGEVTKVTDQLGFVTNQLYDKAGRLVELQHATRAANTVGNWTSSAVQLIDSYAYDGLGQRIQHWNNQFGTTYKELTTYDTQGRVVAMKDFEGRITATTWTWDATLTTTGLGTFGGWTKSTLQTSGKTSTERLDYFGRVTGRTDLGDSGGRTYSMTFDRGGRLVTQSSTAGQSLTWSWYNTGLVSEQKDIAGNAVTFSSSNAVANYDYDVAGHRIHERYATTDFTYVYDPNGSWDPYGGTYTPPTPTQTTTLRQDGYGTYDAMGRLIEFQDRVISTTDPTVTQITFDLNGNVRSTFTKYWTAPGALSTIPGYSRWYKYDAMNRFTLAEGTLESGAIVGGSQLEYDAAGNRHRLLSGMSVETNTVEYEGWEFDPNNGTYQYSPWDGDPDNIPPGYVWKVHYTHVNGPRYEQYDYTADGYLAQVSVTGSVWNATTSTVQTGATTIHARDTRDALGRLTTHEEYTEAAPQGGSNNASQVRTAVYDKTGLILSDSVRTYTDIAGGTGQDYYSTVNSTYSYLEGSTFRGVVTGITTTATKDMYPLGGATTTLAGTQTNYTYNWWDDARQAKITYDGDTGSSSNAVNTSIFAYDVNGKLTYVNIKDGRPRNVTFSTDANGQVLTRTEADNNTSLADPKDQYYYFNGLRIGEITNNSGVMVTDYLQQVNQRTAAPPTGSTPFILGNYAGFGAEFNSAYEALTPNSVRGSGSAWTVHDGDTLQGMAAAVWGDASLWYLIAEANGLTSATALVAGQSLTIPAKAGNVHNTAQTFRPYDPNKAIGDVNPTQAKPPAKPGGCGMVGQIMMVVIAMAVAAIVAPYAIAAIANIGVTAGTGVTAASVSAALAAGTTTAATAVAGVTTTLSAAALIGGGAIAGAVASIASQAFGVATGNQDKFDWKGVGISAISAGVASGLGQWKSFTDVVGKISHGSEAINQGIRGVVRNAVTQGISVATGLQSSFSWTSVAAAGVMAAVGSQTQGIAAEGRLGFAFANLVDGAAGAATRSVLDGSDFGDNLVAMLPDVIGQTIGGLVAGTIRDSLQAEQPKLLIGMVPEGDGGASSGSITYAHFRVNGQRVNMTLRPIAETDLDDLRGLHIQFPDSNIPDLVLYPPENAPNSARLVTATRSGRFSHILAAGSNSTGIAVVFNDGIKYGGAQFISYEAQLTNYILAARRSAQESISILAPTRAPSSSAEAPPEPNAEVLSTPAARDIRPLSAFLPVLTPERTNQVRSVARQAGRMAGSFFDGIVRGDYSDDQSIAAVAGQIVGGFNPLADVRDFSAAVVHVTQGREGAWVDLAASGIGFIPIAGDFAKPLIKHSDELFDVTRRAGGAVVHDLKAEVESFNAMGRVQREAATRATSAQTARMRELLEANAARRTGAAERVGVAEDVGAWDRLSTVGRTPGKSSATGRAVIDRMATEGKIVDDPVLGRMFQASDEEWYPLKLGDMSHNADAVSWWNSAGRSYGPKAPEVREWMLNSDNYTVDLFSINRSAGAKLGNSGVRYLPPTK